MSEQAATQQCRCTWNVNDPCPVHRPLEPWETIGYIEDPEEFCERCLAGLTSSEHHERCVAPHEQRLDEEALADAALEPEKIRFCPPGEHDLEWTELFIGWDPVAKHIWCTQCALNIGIKCLEAAA